VRTSLAAFALLCALAVLSGCGVVQDAARSVLGDDFAGLAGGAGEAPEGAGPSGGGALSIAADEDAAGAVAPERDADDGGSGFYKVVEPNGTVRFVSNLSEVPVEQRGGAERLALAPSKSKPSAPRRAPPRRSAQQLAASDSAPPPAAIAPSTGPHEVVIYTTSWCGWCNKTRAWLDAKGVDYVDKDVERDESAAFEMRELTGGEGGVPVVVIDGQVIRGFDQARMRKLLQI
jgi:glutaredoxin